MEFKVTLAHPKMDGIDFDSPVYIQPKLDGVRCYARMEDGQVVLRSRNHNRFMNVSHLERILGDYLLRFPERILDGELYNHQLKRDFEKIISLVKKKKPTPYQRVEAHEMVQFHVYDIYDGNKPQRLQEARNGVVSMFHSEFGHTDIIQRVSTIKVQSHREIRSWHRANKLYGYEGSIVRLNSFYEQKRSKALIKVKDWQDSEFIITGMVEGKGKFAGGVGKFLGYDLDGREVEVPAPTFTLKQRKWAYDNFLDEYFEKDATFEWFERTKRGAYRFPRFKAIRNYE